MLLSIGDSGALQASLWDADPYNNDPGSSCQATLNRPSGTQRLHTIGNQQLSNLPSPYVDVHGRLPNGLGLSVTAQSYTVKPGGFLRLIGIWIRQHDIGSGTSAQTIANRLLQIANALRQ